MFTLDVIFYADSSSHLFFFFFYLTVQLRNIDVFLSFFSLIFFEKRRIAYLELLISDFSFKRNECYFLRIFSFFLHEYRPRNDTSVFRRARRWRRRRRKSGERRREISRWHNQWTIRPVDSINPCYGAGLRVATTLTINSTRINVNRWHCAARLSRLVKTVGAWRANEASSRVWNASLSPKREVAKSGTRKKFRTNFDPRRSPNFERRFSRVVQENWR